MADLPRNIPSAMTDFNGNVSGGVTDCAASFFNLRTGIHETTDKNNYTNKFHGKGLGIFIRLHADSIPHPSLRGGPDSTLYPQIFVYSEVRFDGFFHSLIAQSMLLHESLKHA
jgi:hypothetical protein